MNTRIRIALALAAGVAGCVIALVAAPAARGQNPPARADDPITGPAPAAGFVWMGGHWDSEAGQWKWVAAHWEQPPSRSATWVAGHWASQGGSWVWVNGAWNVGESPQSPVAPPQPPDSPAAQAPGQTVPMPSTPAPYIESGYGPGGTPRAIDESAVTTDYGPAEYPSYYPGYAAAYPGYYWDGDGWFWGGIPVFGFGWGHGYYGWGPRRGHRGGNYVRGAHGVVGRGGFSGHGAAVHSGGHFH